MKQHVVQQNVLDDVNLFPTDCRKFLTLSNQTSRYKSKCIRIILTTIIKYVFLFQQANSTSIFQQETVNSVAHLPRISAGFSMRLSQKSLVRRKTLMELKTFQQVWVYSRAHEQESPNLTIGFVILVFADSIIELAGETKDLLLTCAIKPHSIISCRPC